MKRFLILALLAIFVSCHLDLEDNNKDNETTENVKTENVKTETHTHSWCFETSYDGGTDYNFWAVWRYRPRAYSIKHTIFYRYRCIGCNQTKTVAKYYYETVYK